MKVVMVVAPKNFQESEYMISRNVFLDNNVQVTTASTFKGELIGMMGMMINSDITIADINANDYDGIVLVGGSGATVYFNNFVIFDVIRSFNKLERAIGAICIAPSILANCGVLSGKKVTSFPSEKANLERNGAEYVDQGVVVSGNIVTGNGPRVVREFATKLIGLINAE